MSRVDARIVRRETHSPRSAAAVAVAIALIVVVAWLAAEGVLSLLGARPLLLAPRTALTAVAAAPQAGHVVLIATAVVAGLAGLWLLALAVLPGRRPRRRLEAEHLAVVADDEMLASALARRAARTAGVAPDAATVSLARRRGVVRIVPVSGMRIDRDEVRHAVAEEFDETRSGTRPRLSVLVSPTGKVGS
ncbi:DUF6286 domain-containing protein [Leifsonia aquatica]|uniref:DUF6286 domain-containing protein n=1 Tax=Leifsonia aquatica TaxID=144185 RepID=UPI000468FFC4|nr:DUF6286 domain-containing protein [Leifsonia aquatica]